jgi:hypothetical protein
MQRIFISFGVHGNRLDAQLVTCTNDSESNLTAVRDEHFFEW